MGIQLGMCDLSHCDQPCEQSECVREDQKLLRIENCKDIGKEAKKEVNFFYNIVNDDETWCFQYNPETERQSSD